MLHIIANVIFNYISFFYLLQNVRKSRGVQTLLTKDTYMDEDPGADNVNPR